MKTYFRSQNDPKRFKPMVVAHIGSNGSYWTITTTTINEVPRIRITYTFHTAVEQANRWADEYRAARVARNMTQGVAA